MTRTKYLKALHDSGVFRDSIVYHKVATRCPGHTLDQTLDAIRMLRLDMPFGYEDRLEDALECKATGS